MSTTVEEIARDISASFNTLASVPLIAQWANNRYREMVARVKFRHLRQVGELSLSAIVDTGTVSATRGSATITPDAAAQAAWLTSPGVASHEYWYIRLQSVWYEVASVDALAATITLNSAFAEEDISAGSYELVQRYYPLSSTARWVGDFIHDRFRVPVEITSIEELNTEAPSRILVGHYPRYASQIGVDSSGYLMFEIYPPSTETELIHYVYWSLPSTLTISSNIPDVIDPYTLKEGIAVDVYRFDKVNQIKLGNIEAAAVDANEEAKQRTIWGKAIKDAIRTSRGVDDITLILQMNRGQRRRSYDQRTARDYVYQNWGS